MSPHVVLHRFLEVVDERDRLLLVEGVVRDEVDERVPVEGVEDLQIPDGRARLLDADAVQDAPRVLGLVDLADVARRLVERVPGREQGASM